MPKRSLLLVFLRLLRFFALILTLCHGDSSSSDRNAVGVAYDANVTAAEWPELKYADWSDTCETLHLWTQIAGKLRMANAPAVNHWWHVPLYVTSRGLGTSPIPKRSGTFDIDFDFIDHRLLVSTTDGKQSGFDLEPMTVADFYERTMAIVRDAGCETNINTMPSEISDAIPFENDRVHASYDRDAVSRFWKILVSTCRVMTQFRSEFIGKVSPVHFFWGGFDLAVTRFSGRLAPLHPPVTGVPLKVVREAYSHEVSSAGFWPGAPGIDAFFYSYAYPEPPGYPTAAVQPPEAAYDSTMGEFLLPYDALRAAADPESALMAFFRTTYDAAASLGHWDREALERQEHGESRKGNR
jgi:hypothetical protein